MCGECQHECVYKVSLRSAAYKESLRDFWTWENWFQEEEEEQLEWLFGTRLPGPTVPTQCSRDNDDSNAAVWLIMQQNTHHILSAISQVNPG